MRRRSVLVPAISLRVASHVICRTSSSHRAHRPDVARRRECERGLRYIGCCKFQTSRAVPGGRVARRARASGGPHRNVTHVIRRKADRTHPRCIAKRHARRRRHPCRNDVRTSHACTRLAGSTVAHAWGFSPRRRTSRAMVRKRCVGETGACARAAAAACARRASGIDTRAANRQAHTCACGTPIAHASAARLPAVGRMACAAARNTLIRR